MTTVPAGGAGNAAPGGFLPKFAQRATYISLVPASGARAIRSCAGNLGGQAQGMRAAKRQTEIVMQVQESEKCKKVKRMW